MSEFYSALTDTASGLIEAFGSSFLAQRTESDSSITSITGSGVMDSIVNHLSPGESRVRIGDYKFIVNAGYSPKMGDTFTINSVSYIVVDYKPIKPADQVVATYVWCRKG